MKFNQKLSTPLLLIAVICLFEVKTICSVTTREQNLPPKVIQPLVDKPVHMFPVLQRESGNETGHTYNQRKGIQLKNGYFPHATYPNQDGSWNLNKQSSSPTNSLFGVCPTCPACPAVPPCPVNPPCPATQPCSSTNSCPVCPSNPPCPTIPECPANNPCPIISCPSIPDCPTLTCPTVPPCPVIPPPPTIPPCPSIPPCPTIPACPNWTPPSSIPTITACGLNQLAPFYSAYSGMIDANPSTAQGGSCMIGIAASAPYTKVNLACFGTIPGTSPVIGNPTSSANLIPNKLFTATGYIVISIPGGMARNKLQCSWALA